MATSGSERGNPADQEGFAVESDSPALSNSTETEFSKDDPVVQEGRGVTRRFVNKVLAFAGMGAVLGTLKSDKFFPAAEASPNDHKESAELSHKLDQEAKRIAAKRERIMKTFLNELGKEIDGKDM